MALNPNGTVVLLGISKWDAGSRGDAIMAVDASTGSTLWTHSPTEVSAPPLWGPFVVFSPNGLGAFLVHETYAQGTSCELKLSATEYAPTTGALQRTFDSGCFGTGGNLVSGPGRSARTAAFSLSGTRLILGGHDQSAIVAAAFDVASGSLVWQRTYRTEIPYFNDMELSADGSRLVITGTTFDYQNPDIVVISLDALNGQPLWTKRFDNYYRKLDVGVSVSISPSGNRVLVAGGSSSGACCNWGLPTPIILSYQASDGQLLWTHEGDGLKGFGANLGAALSSDGTHYYVVGYSYDSNDLSYLGCTNCGGAIMASAYETIGGNQIWLAHYNSAAHVAERGTGMALSSDGHTVYVAGDLRDTELGQDIGLLSYATSANSWQPAFVEVQSTQDSRLPPAGAPHNNTLGWTASGPGLNSKHASTDSPLVVPVNMGQFAKKGFLSDDAGGYLLRIGYKVEGSFVQDNDGQYDPYTSTASPPGDDPCHSGSFDLFELAVNGHTLHTLRGTNEGPCDREGPRTFDVIPMQGQPAADAFRIPTAWITNGTNEVQITVADSGYASPLSRAADRGWRVEVDWVQIELAAPPTFLVPGWSPNEMDGHRPLAGDGACSSIPGVAQWECEMKSNIVSLAQTAFGQNPWQWDGLGGDAAIQPWGYNPKQDIDSSALLLDDFVSQQLMTLGYNGTPAIIAHSMGGLVAKAYAVGGALHPLRPSLRASPIVTIATPHSGTLMADWYTCAYPAGPAGIHVTPDPRAYYWTRIPSRDINQQLLLSGNQGTTDCSWRDYYPPTGGSDVLGAFRYSPTPLCVLASTCFQLPDDFLADFQLKQYDSSPGTPNRYLAALDRDYWAASTNPDSDLFTIAGVCGTTSCPMEWALDAFGGSPTTILATPNHDLVVDQGSALNLPHDNRKSICTGSTFWHLGLVESSEVHGRALQGLAGAWTDPTLEAITSNCS